MDKRRLGKLVSVSVGLALVMSCLLPALATEVSAQGTTITGTVVDTTPPAAVTDLVVTSRGYSSLTLAWTAPGDDGTLGTATQYDIRYSTSTITDANWDSASQCSGEPTPQSTGSSETFTVTGLSSGTRYYFGLKTADEVPNWSDLSNVTSGVTEYIYYYTPPIDETNLNIDFMGSTTKVKINKGGIIQDDVTLASPDEDWALEIAKGTKILTADGTAATKIVAGEAAEELPPPSDGTIVKTIELGPTGTTFAPPATLKMTFPASELPKDTSSVVIAYYSPETGWTEVHTEWNKTDGLVIVTAQISHFTPFAVIYYLPSPPVFTISDLTISHNQVEPGQKIVIIAIVTNSGGTAGDYTVELKINDLTEASKQLYVYAGASVIVDFTVSKYEGGNYQVDVNGLTGEFTIIEVPPVFTISDLSISHNQVEPGQKIVITAIVTNSGGTAGDYTVGLKINNLTEASKQLSVDAGASVIVDFIVTKDESGSYQVNVNGLTGEFTIIEVPSEQLGETTPPSQPWLSLPWYIWVIIGVVLVAAGTASWLIVRWRSHKQTY